MASCLYSTYCISNTGNAAINDNYVKQPGVYNDNSFYLGQVNGYYIYFSVRGYWCLSYDIEGECLLTGKNPCFSVCPDFCDDYLTRGVCPPTPPPPINPCEIIDFEAYFDCDVPITPTTTPTNTPTPSITPTMTSTMSCPLFIDATIQSYTPTPNPTPTVTPSSSQTIARDCGFLGDVTFNTIDTTIDCPFSIEFQDCYNGFTYYTTKSITRPEGGNLEKFMIYQATVDGMRRCISYVGVNTNIIGNNTISLTSNLIGYSNLGQCVNCLEVLTPTPTPTPSITPTITLTSSSNKPPTPDPSNTPTPTRTRTVLYYVYTQCGTYNRVAQPIPVFLNSTLGQTFRTGSNGFAPNTCWTLDYISQIILNNPAYNTTVYNTNAFTSILPTIYTSCANCLSGNNGSSPNPPQVSPSPTMTVTPSPTKPSQIQACKPHTVKQSNIACSVCNNTVPSITTIYSLSNFLNAGVQVYSNSTCTTPIPAAKFLMAVSANDGTVESAVFVTAGSGVLSNYSCSNC